MPYTGNHRRIVVYCAIAKDGRQLFRTRESFDAPTFVWYMKELQRYFGKAAVMMDRASPHRAKAVKRLLRENKSIKNIYLRKGSPYLNAVEEWWRQGKQVLLVLEYYRTSLIFQVLGVPNRVVYAISAAFLLLTIQKARLG